MPRYIKSTDDKNDFVFDIMLDEAEARVYIREGYRPKGTSEWINNNNNPCDYRFEGDAKRAKEFFDKKIAGLSKKFQLAGQETPELTEYRDKRKAEYGAFMKQYTDWEKEHGFVAQLKAQGKIYWVRNDEYWEQTLNGSTVVEKSGKVGKGRVKTEKFAESTPEDALFTAQTHMMMYFNILKYAPPKSA